MTSSPFVDPELAGMLELLPTLSLTDEMLQAARSMALPQTALPDTVTAGERHVPGPDGSPDVRVLVTRPAHPTGQALPVLVWIHGGGYVLGTADADQPFAAEIVQRIGCIVVSVDYRLAPETRHPGPIEDCYAALRWVHAEAASLGADPARIAIGGESAGGGLAAALGILARDRGEVPVVFQALVYPMLDDRAVVEDRDPTTGDYVWTRGSNRFGWESLLGVDPGSPDVSVYAAPGRLEDATGLPPTFISVGQLDLFREEDTAYAATLMRAGVPTTLHIYAGAFHGFMHLPSTLMRRHNDELMDLLAAALGSGS